MKEIGKEIIEIGGVEYTLFLNRKGIIAWEKYAKKEREIITELKKKADEVKFEGEIKEDTNPFEGLDIVDEIDKESEVTSLYFQKLYWIMLYENHKLSFEAAKALYKKACEEYGETQIIKLGSQMVEDANVNPKQNENQAQLKNLKALRPTK